MAQKSRKTTKAKLPRGNPRGGIPGDIMPGETAGLVDVNPLSAEALLGDPQLTDAERALLQRLSNTTPQERAILEAAVQANRSRAVASLRTSDAGAAPELWDAVSRASARNAALGYNPAAAAANPGEDLQTFIARLVSHEGRDIADLSEKERAYFTRFFSFLTPEERARFEAERVRKLTTASFRNKVGGSASAEASATSKLRSLLGHEPPAVDKAVLNERAVIQRALADARSAGTVDPELAKIIGKADFADRRAAMRAGVRKSVLEAERAAVGEVPKMSAKAARAARSAAAEAAAAGADGVETAAAVQAAIKKAGGTAAGAAGEAAAVGSQVAGKVGLLGRVGGVVSKALPTLGVLAGLYTLYEATIGRAQEDRHQGAADLLNTAMGMEGYGDELANRSYARTLENVTPAASELQYASQMNAVRDQGQLGQMLAQNQAALSQAAHVSTPSFQEYLLELRAAQAAAYGGN